VQVAKQLSNLDLRVDELKSGAQRHEKALQKYEQWQEKTSETSLAELKRFLVEQGEKLTSIFPEASHKLPNHLLRAELPAAKDDAVRQAAGEVAKAKFSAAKTVKIGERMLKLAKSADERDYAERMLQQGEKGNEENIRHAEAELARVKAKRLSAFKGRAVKQVAAQSRAWHQQHQAAAEISLRQEYLAVQAARKEHAKGKEMKHTKRIVTRGTSRASGAAVKRAVVSNNHSYDRLKKEVSHKRWQREGQVYVDTASPSRWGAVA
jgi:hypothetical protein